MNAIDEFEKGDFTAYMLIWAANADSKITSEELALMVDHSGNRDHHARAWTAFHAQSDFDRVLTIQTLKERFFPGPEGKAEILALVQRMLDADGKFTASEAAYKSALARLL